MKKISKGISVFLACFIGLSAGAQLSSLDNYHGRTKYLSNNGER